MPKNPNSTPSQPSNEDTPIIVPADESVLESLHAFRQKQIEKAPEEAARFFKNIYEIQGDFERRSQIVSEQNSIMSQKEFERWEDAFSFEYNLAQKEINQAHLNLDTIAEATQNMVTSTDDSELHKTIEAQAGNFYYERANNLRKAIQESDDPSAEKDLKCIGDFLSSVERHLDFKYMSPEDVKDYGYSEYEAHRTAAHNDAIEHLNSLNDLAKKYGTHPFTVRNFWTSRLRNKRGQTRAIAKVMRYDRDIVEEYYAIAFSSEVRKRKAAQEHKEKYGL